MEINFDDEVAATAKNVGRSTSGHPVPTGELIEHALRDGNRLPMPSSAPPVSELARKI